MPTPGSGTISIDVLSNFMGGGRPDSATDYRGLDGSWNRSAITYSWNSYYARPQGYFSPAPGSERLTFWFYDGSINRWNLRFNPTVTAAGSGSVVYYVQSNGTSPVTPSQFNYAGDQFSIIAFNQWKQINRFYQKPGDGIRYYRIQAHNGVPGYRALLPYYWNASA